MIIDVEHTLEFTLESREEPDRFSMMVSDPDRERLRKLNLLPDAEILTTSNSHSSRDYCTVSENDSKVNNISIYTFSNQLWNLTCDRATIISGG